MESLPPGTVVIHGAASGADSIAGWLAEERGLQVLPFPVTDADWDAHGKAAGGRRNQQMLDEGRPDFAFGYRTFGHSPGTDDMHRRLVEHRVPTKQLVKDGRHRPPDPPAEAAE